jgi:hypothetical protein
MKARLLVGRGVLTAPWARRYAPIRASLSTGRDFPQITFAPCLPESRNCSAAVSAAGSGGVSPPRPTPSETLGEPAGGTPAPRGSWKGTARVSRLFLWFRSRRAEDSPPYLAAPSCDLRNSICPRTHEVRTDVIRFSLPPS